MLMAPRRYDTYPQPPKSYDGLVGARRTGTEEECSRPPKVMMHLGQPPKSYDKAIRKCICRTYSDELS